MIKLFGVTKTFDGDVVALSDISLEIAKGELLVLTGPSGAGKSTLLRTIFAAERPDAGHIVIAGRNISRLRSSSIPYLRRNVGVVFQDFKLLGNRSALRNVAISLEIRGLPRKQVRQRALDALAAVGLQRSAHVRVAALSGGEQQRVAIARAVVGNPAILLADEPTGNLDPDWSRDILALLNAVAQRGTTVVIATHDPTVLENAAYSRLVRLDSGRVEEIQARIPGPVEVSAPDPSSSPGIQRVAPLPPAESVN